MSGLLKNEGVHQMEVKTLGGVPGRGQDVTIILVPKGGSRDHMSARIHLHSHVLSTHSKYFNTCLSERWNPRVSPSSEPIEFVLEVQRDVQHYFDCFSNMYPPFGKSFESVEHGLELLKVASQIDFGLLMERISFFLSSMLWSEEEETRVREYASSPDFPRIHLKNLVSRLGLDESEEDRQMQLCVLVNGVLKASSLTPSVLTFQAFLEAIGRAPPSEYSRKVFAILSRAAKYRFVDIENECKQTTSMCPSNAFRGWIQAMSWILKALLQGQVAEELVQGIVHLDAIPQYVVRLPSMDAIKREFAEVVLLMYKEVVAGRLVLQPPQRMALLANWHVLVKFLLKLGTFEQASADLFLTLPLKQQAELIHLKKGNVFDFISSSSLSSVLRFH